MALLVKNLPAYTGDTRDKDSIENGSERSPGEGNGNPLSILVWRIPRTEEPGGLWSMGVAKELDKTERAHIIHLLPRGFN